jgi:hypothetical protein
MPAKNYVETMRHVVIMRNNQFDENNEVSERFIEWSHLYIIMLIFFVLAAARPAQATLGETAESVESDIRNLTAVRGADTVRNSYTVQEIRYGETAVREYVSPPGVVFGIAWNGLTHPDLTQLLGPYLGEYEEALRQSTGTGDRSRFELKTKRLVVEKWGHMRNLQGRAYAPELIPSGVKVDEIR